MQEQGGQLLTFMCKVREKSGLETHTLAHRVRE